jgi:hypothetical protein
MRASWKSAWCEVGGGVVVVAGEGVDIAAEVEVVEDIVVEVAEGIVAAAAAAVVVEGSIAEQEVVDVAAAGESGCFAEHKLAPAAGDKAMARSLSIEACLAWEAD